MSDWPTGLIAPPGMAITSASPSCGLGPQVLAQSSFGALATAWPSANLALYIPFVLEVPVTVSKISWENGATLSGTIDVGLYDINRNAIVRLGPTTQAGISVIQVGAIASTALNPGVYFMAMSASSATATVRSTAIVARLAQIAGVQQQAASSTLPATATFANPGFAFQPFMAVHLASTV